MPDRSLLWCELFWSRPLSPDDAVRRLTALATDPRWPLVVIEARACRRAVKYLVGAELAALNSVLGLLDVPTAPLIQPRSSMMTARRVTLRPRLGLLDTSHPEVVAAGLLAALTEADRDGEELVLQVVLGPRLAPTTPPPSTSEPQSWVRVVLGTSSSAASPNAKTTMQKTATAGFQTVVRLGVTAGTPSRRQALALGVLGALHLMQTPSSRLGLVPEHSERLGTAALVQVPRWRWPLRLNAAEATSLAGLPMSKTDDDLPGLPAAHPRLLPLPDTNRSGTGGDAARTFATSNAPATQDQPVSLSTGDNLTHLSVVAPTGAGKSTLLHHLIRGDMAGGNGLVVVDPKGDLVEAALTTVPRSRLGDVVVLDLTDNERPVGFNPLRTVAGQSPEVVAESVVAVFAELWPETGVRTLDVLSAAVFTLTGLNAALVARREKNVATLLDVPRLLSDQTFRSRIIGQVDDESLTGFWEGYAALSSAQAAETIAPVMRRLRQFLSRRSLRGVLGQAEPRFDLSEVFAPSNSGQSPKVLLVPLNKAAIGEQTARMFGALLVASVWHQTLRRSTVPVQQRSPVSVVLDEAPDLLRLPLSLGDALAQARGYGVGFTLVAQFRGQWPAALREAVDANTLSKVAFRLPAGDARAMAALTAGQVGADDFISLDQHQIYASLAVNGHPSDWFSARTLPPPTATSSPRDLRRASSERYGQVLTAKPTTTAPETSESVGRRRA